MSASLHSPFYQWLLCFCMCNSLQFSLNTFIVWDKKFQAVPTISPSPLSPITQAPILAFHPTAPASQAPLALRFTPLPSCRIGPIPSLLQISVLVSSAPLPKNIGPQSCHFCHFFPLFTYITRCERKEGQYGNVI